MRGKTLAQALELAKRCQREPEALTTLIAYLEVAVSRLESARRPEFNRTFQQLTDVEKAEYLYALPISTREKAQLAELSTRRVHQLLKLAQLPSETRKVLHTRRVSERRIRPLLNLPRDTLLQSIDCVVQHSLTSSECAQLAVVVRGRTRLEKASISEIIRQMRGSTKSEPGSQGHQG